MIEAERTPWTDVAEHLGRPGAAPPSRLAVLPFGALEQHGPQLPLGTDTFQAVHVARGIALALDAVLLPAVPYGDTWNNAGYPGTVSLSASTVAAIALDIGRALAASPAPASGLVIVNGDWGNRTPLYGAVRTLLQEGFPAVALDYPGLDAAATEVRTTESAAPGLNHADELETSMMLAIDGTLVHPERSVAVYPSFPGDFGTTPMQLHPFSPSGVFGDPTAATPETGRRLLDATVAGSLEVLADFVARLG
ncbi:creatininase family protein [Cnuibacter sp. UC19_7]|uniref:creatininase family protein n=1 Tax=Cnuibacter sp. UC19_7 TaxID=3350166 RepID=UPI00366B0322